MWKERVQSLWESPFSPDLKGLVGFLLDHKKGGGGEGRKGGGKEEGVGEKEESLLLTPLLLRSAV